MKEASNSDKPILFNIQGSKAEKREFRARQKAKFIGGQHEAFQDRDDGQEIVSIFLHTKLQRKVDFQEVQERIWELCNSLDVASLPT